MTNINNILPNGQPISRTLHLSKKASAKNCKPECESSKFIAQHWTKSKTLSPEDLTMLRAAGYTIQIEITDQFTKKSPSTIDLPHVKVFYDKLHRTWVGQWLNPKDTIGLCDLIVKTTKKRVLEALIAQEIDIRNQ